MCLARSQTIHTCYFHQGAKVENITKILIVCDGVGRGRRCLFSQPTVFILFDVGMQNELAEVHNTAIQEQRRFCVGNIKHAQLRGLCVCACMPFKGEIPRIHVRCFKVDERARRVSVLTCAYSDICIDTGKARDPLLKKKATRAH